MGKKRSREDGKDVPSKDVDAMDEDSGDDEVSFFSLLTHSNLTGPC
jgi:hypothetical protein